MKKFLVLSISLIVIISAIYLFSSSQSKSSIQIYAAGSPVVDATFAVYADGTPLFDSDNNPGNDDGAHNARVRTNDDIMYQVELNLNESDSANTRFEMTVDQYQYINDIPSACLTTGVTPISSITNSGKTLLCNLGIVQEGTTSIVRPVARVLGNAPNGTIVTADLTVTADSANTVVPAQLETLVTASPKYDVVKTLKQSDFEGYDDNGNIGFKYKYHISISKLKGSEDIQGNEIFLEDILTYSGIGLNYKLLGCSVNDGSFPNHPYGKVGINSFASVSNSVTDSGSINCTQTSLGSAIEMQITGIAANTSVFPIQYSDNASISLDKLFIGSYLLEIFVPRSDFGTPPQPSYVINNTVSLSPGLLSLSGVNVYDYNTSNNTVDINLPFGYITSGNFAAWNGKTFDKYHTGEKTVLRGDIITALLDTGHAVENGLSDNEYIICDKVDTANLEFVGIGVPDYIRNFEPSHPSNSWLDIYGAYYDKIILGTNGYQGTRSLGLEWANESIPQPNFSPSFVTLAVMPSWATKYLFEGTVEYATSPVSSLAYDTCDDADGPWYPVDYQTGNPPLSDATKIRMVYDFSSSATPFVSQVRMFMTPSFRVKQDATNGYIANFARVKNSYVGSPWGATTWIPYSVSDDPANPLYSYGGYTFDVYHQGSADRVKLIDARIRIDKVTTDLPNDAKSQYNPGDLAHFELNSTLEYPVPSTSGLLTTVTIHDTLPAGLTYNGNVVYGIPDTPSTASCLITSGPTENPNGTTDIEWTCINVPQTGQVNSIPTIGYETIVNSELTRAELPNQVTISSPADTGSLLVDRTDVRTIYTQVYGDYSIVKNVDTPSVQVNDQITFDLGYANNSAYTQGLCSPGLNGVLDTPENTPACIGDDVQSNISFIDIFPYNGDSVVPGSNYTGQLLFDNIKQTIKGKEFFSFTNAAPSTISIDPNNNTSLTWCGSFNTATVTLADVRTVCGATYVPTAVRFETSVPIDAGEFRQHLKLTFQTNNNRNGDIYTNQFASRVPEITLPTVSNDVTAIVHAGVVGNYTWYDPNSNGVKDSGELDLPNMQVCITGGGQPSFIDPTKLNPGADQLFGTADDMALCQNTNGTGNYLFQHLRSGTYTLKATPPSGYTQTYDATGALDNESMVTLIQVNEGTHDVYSYVSDILPYELNSYPTLKEVTTQTTALSSKSNSELNDNIQQDFGYTGNASLGGKVYFDKNNSGSYDAGDELLSGVTVTLSNGLTKQTDTNGEYLFSNLLPGTYNVTETQPTLYSDSLDFVGSAGGTLSNDNISSITLTSGMNATGYDFSEIKLYKLSGTVWYDKDRDSTIDSVELVRISGTTITLTGPNGTQTATTDSNGYYEFTNLVTGNYTITETQPSIYGSSTPNVITLDLIADSTNNNFGETLSSISGRVYADDNYDGIYSTTDRDLVTIVTLTGPISASVTTNADGTYLFDELPLGDYTVIETQVPGYMDSGDNIGSEGGDVLNNDEISLSLPAGVDAINYNFGEIQLAELSGYTYIDTNQNGVKDTGETILPNVVIIITNGETAVTLVSDSSGYYEATDLPFGTYQIVEETLDLYTLTSDHELEVILSAENLNDTENNFGYIQLADIVVNIYGDANQNKTKDSGEVNMQVCTVILKRDGVELSRATPDANGNVVFANRELGAYTVEVTCGDYIVTTGTTSSFTLTLEGTMQYFGVIKPLAKTGYQLW